MIIMVLEIRCQPRFIYYILILFARPHTYSQADGCVALDGPSAGPV